MQFFGEGTLSICKKVILVSIIIFFSISTRVVAMEMIDSGDCILPSHDEIAAEMSYLIDQESGATVLQKIKKYASLSNGFIEITPENAPKIYQVLESAAKTIGVEIPSKVYIYLLHTPCKTGDYYNSGVFTKYLSVGGGILLELTSREAKAVLEHEFMHIKDHLLSQSVPKIREIVHKNRWLHLYSIYLDGALVVVSGFVLKSMYSQEYFNLFVEFGVIGLILIAAVQLVNDVNSDVEMCNFVKEFEKHADLNVSSKSDLASAFKNMAVISEMEKNKHLPAEERDRIKRDLIEKIENGSFDFSEQFPDHPSTQERLAYLIEADK